MRNYPSLAMAVVVALSASDAAPAMADTLAPQEYVTHDNLWYSSEDPSEQALVQHEQAGAIFLIAGCDVLDGIYPYLALGVMDHVNWRVKEQTLGFRDQPDRGLVLTVRGTIGGRPFEFRTDEGGNYGGTSTGRRGNSGDQVIVSYAGGGILPAQLRMLMRADRIVISALGIDNIFSARGSSRALGRLSCSADQE